MCLGHLQPPTIAPHRAAASVSTQTCSSTLLRLNQDAPPKLVHSYFTLYSLVSIVSWACLSPTLILTLGDSCETSSQAQTSKRYLAPLMRPDKVPRHPGLPGEEHRGFPAPLPLSPFYPPDLDRRVDSPALSGRGSRPSGRTSGRGWLPAGACKPVLGRTE